MNDIGWVKRSATAGIVSAVAILIALVYLAIQTRHLAARTAENTEAIQATVRQEMLSTELELLRTEVEYPSLALVGRDGQSPTPEQLAQLNAYLTSLLRVREIQWREYERGAIDARTWQTYRNAIPAMLSQQIRRAWWQGKSAPGRDDFDPEFVDLVNELLTESAASQQR
ncbi:MAG: hypothetical protein PVG24_14120 [Gammaproteobacteria bacterium]|jgi:hypothetical protein